MANHREVQQAVLNLSDPLKIEIKELEVNGALHYLQRHEDYYAKVAKHLE